MKKWTPISRRNGSFLILGVCLILIFVLNATITKQYINTFMCVGTDRVPKSLDKPKNEVEKREMQIRRSNNTTLVNDLPMIYVITPTYTRLSQKVELTVLCQTLMLVREVTWIIVEDSSNTSQLVSRLLKSCPVPHVHLHEKTVWPVNFTGSRKPKGSHQRIRAVNWLRENASRNGIFYFADDDNTYSYKLFEEIRKTKIVSVWQVGFAGAVYHEGPVCEGGVVIEWRTGWRGERKFPIDMAGFAIHVRLLDQHPELNFDLKIPRGYLETKFLEKAVKSQKELECRENDGLEVLVWHTKSQTPVTKQEMEVRKMGKRAGEILEV